MRGQCLCGAVAFELDARALKLYRCHCSLCRKQSGTSSNCAALVAGDHFRWLAGREAISSWRKATGFRSDFCSLCGAPVPHQLRSTQFIWVPAGSLEAAADLTVVADLYMSSRASWDKTRPEGAQFPEAPAAKELLALLHDE